MATSETSRLQPLYTSVTLTEGELFQIALEGSDANKQDAFKWISSDSDHATVNQSGFVTAKGAGEATITIQDVKNNRVIREAKVKLYIIKGNLLVTGEAQSLLPLYVDDQVRQILNKECGITSLINLIEKAGTREQREGIAEKTGMNAATVGVWFRQAVLFQIKGITKEIAYLAAMAGFRNAYDFARADFNQVKSIFRILVNSIKLPTQETLTLPLEDEVLLVLNNAIKMEPADSPYYSVVGADDPEPTFLLSKDANVVKTDTQVLQEGLEFLNNIKMALPLPTTISGKVEMKSEVEGAKTRAKCGLKVSISGIANPARDKSEGDNELWCYTGENGEFSIVMPDRYNMQETIKLTVTEDKNETYSGTFKTSVEAANAVNQTTFVKRASEIISAEYVNIPDGYDENGNLKYKKYNAVGILQSIDRIILLNNEILVLEEKLYEKATNQSQLIKEDLQTRKIAADEQMEACELAIKEELAYHYQLKNNEIVKKEAELQELKKQKSEEFSSIFRRQFRETFNQYNQERKKLGLKEVLEDALKDGTYRLGKEYRLKEQVAQPSIRVPLNTNEAVTLLTNSIERLDLSEERELRNRLIPEGDKSVKPKTAEELLAEKMREPSGELLVLSKEFLELEQNVEVYRIIEKRLEEESRRFSTTGVKNGRFYLIPLDEKGEQKVTLCVTSKLWDLQRQINALTKEIERLKQERDLLATDLQLSEERFSALKKEHEAICGAHSEIPDFERIKDLCHLSQDKINAYLLAENTCLELARQLEIASKNVDAYSKMSILETYCDSKWTKDEMGNVTGCDDQVVAAYLEKKQERGQLEELIYALDETTNEFRRTVLNFLSRRFDADLGTLTLHKETFERKELKPRALPSVKLMGDGEDAVYLPTDTAPARMFSYAMMQRLVEPEIRKNNREYTRQKMTDALDIMSFKKNLYGNQQEIAIATSLGIGYMLNMHQAWVPDGYTLGNLLYSLVLAPGEEQRIIIREHKESYMVTDEASAEDTVNDSYRNNQEDNETAAFSNGARRFSSAHTDSSYTTTTKSSGKSRIGLFFGIGAKSSASSTTTGSSASNSYQSDSYDEVSNAAQNFQSSIQTEAARIATARRASISIASSDETETLSSKIIANHNHSHVMTVQYWEVMRRYCLETCIEGVELALFVPMKLVDFMPKKSLWGYADFSNYTLDVSDFTRFTKNSFNHRYRQLLEYADVLAPALPTKFAGGLELIRKFASYPEWQVEKKIGSADKKIELTLEGYFMEFDDITAQLYFNNGSMSVAGQVESFSYYGIHPSMNKRSEVLYAMKMIRNGKNVEKDSSKIGWHADVDVFKQENLAKLSNDDNQNTTLKQIKFVFYLPSSASVNDISHVYVNNNLHDWEYHLSQNQEYMEDAEKVAIENYEHWKYNFSHDSDDNSKDLRRIDHYQEGLPECYLNPIVKFSRNELIGVGAIQFTAVLNIPGQKNGKNTPSVSASKIGTSPVRIDLSNHLPVLGYNEIMEMENTLHHVASDTLHYSQVVWESLTDNERIMLLEPYTVEFNKPEKLAEGQKRSVNSSIKKIPLLNCVNAKKLLGFYGNCMLLPFTYPQELADILGKTAADIQDELYRYHTSNFRVPSTVVSIPTDGMVGEAVLGATNVSEKIDITRFWNWKDSDIDHIELNQSALNGNSLLANAQTKFVDAPTSGVEATAHIDSNGLVNALIARAQPTFADALGNTDLRDLMKTVDTNAAAGRDNVIKSNADILKTTIQAAASAAGSAMTGGAGGLGGILGGATGSILGDTDVLKGTLASLGFSDEEAGSMVKQLSSGSLNVGDLIKKATQKKAQGNGDNGGNGGNGGSGGSGDNGGDGRTGQDPDTNDDGGSHLPGVGEDNNQNPGQQDKDKTPESRTHTEDQNSDRSDNGLIKGIRQMLSYITAEVSPIDAFNKWLRESVNTEYNFIEEELDLIRDCFYSENQIDGNKLEQYLQEKSS